MADHTIMVDNGPQQRMRRLVLNNIQYWQSFIQAHHSDSVALDRERKGILDGLDLSLRLAEAWLPTKCVIEMLTPYMEGSGHWETWGDIVRRAINVSQHLADTEAAITLSILLARLSRRQSQFLETVWAYRRAALQARSINDPFSEARAYTNLGYLYIEYGLWWRAEILCRYALSLFTKIDSPHGLAHTENHLGVLYTRQGHWEQAERHLQQACQIWQTSNDDYGLLNGYVNLTLLYNDMKLVEKALEYGQCGLALAEKKNEQATAGSLYLNIGNTYRLKGDFNQAERYYHQADRLFQRHNNILAQAELLDNLGLLCLDKRTYDQAQHYLTSAQQSWQQLKHRPYEIRCILYIVEGYLSQGDKSQATCKLVEVEKLLEQHDPGERFHHQRSQFEELRRRLSPGAGQSCDEG